MLTQPKRLAVLVWTALRRPGGFVSRDELVGTFWGDSDEARARAALRQALRFLRSRLGPETLVNRGDGDVGVEGLSVDAVDLHRALERGDDRSTVELWTGELMPGFVLDDASAFGDWLHLQRRRFRTGVSAAALRLAEAAEARGDLPGAVAAAALSLDLSPLNEEVARRLMRLHARGGDRSAALQVFDTLRARLREDLELEPAAETLELEASIRGGRASAAADASGGGARERSAARVLVLELENLTGDPALDPVGRLAAERMAQGLSTMEELEVVPPFAVGPAGETVPAGDEGAGPGTAGLPGPLAELVDRTGAGTVVGGSYHLAGDTLRLQVRITDAVEGRLRPAPDPVDTLPSDPVAGIERLRDDLMTVLGPALTRRAVHVREASRPPGMAAYRAYLDGLDLFIRGEWRNALALFRQATDAAPGYALPRIVGAIALWNLDELPEAHAVAEEAQALRGSLGRFERGVLDNVRAWLVGDWAAAHRAARFQAELAPGSIPHFQVAEEARRLNRPAEALRILSQLDPGRGELRGWVFYWIELATAHHLLGDHAAELEAAARARLAHPDDPAVLLLELRALAGLGRHEEIDRVAERALASPANRRPWAGELLTEGALELMVHGARDRAATLLERAAAWYRDSLRSGASEDPGMRRAWATTLYHAGDLEEAQAMFGELARISDGRPQPAGHHHGRIHGHLDEGYLAVIAARLGDRRTADRWRSFLLDLGGPFLYGANWYWLAKLAAVEDDPEGAVLHLRRAFADGLPMSLAVHTDPHLADLRGSARFDALLQPRG